MEQTMATATAMTQREKAEAFRALHYRTGEILVLPNAWDAASARIYEGAGFPAVATTSAGVAFSLGYPDGQSLPREELLFVVRRITATVSVPVSVDIEAGYGGAGEGTLAEVVRTVQGILAAGAVGINLEDAIPGEARLLDAGEQRERIEALRQLGDREGIPLVINARTDAFKLSGMSNAERLDLAVARLNAYRAAGADCLFAPFLSDAATIGALAAAVDGPLNILAVAGTPPAPELARLGVARVSVGGGPFRAVLAHLRDEIAASLHDEGSFDAFTRHAIPYDELQRLFART